MSLLFQPQRLRGLELFNRIHIAPMCQYQATAHDGVPTDWHTAHWAQMAMSGAALFWIEATGVSPEGRISPACLGLWNDGQAEAFARHLHLARKHSDAAIGIQLGHAGRKAGCNLPWLGAAQLSLDEGGWITRAPSSIPHKPHEREPLALSLDDITQVKRDFVDAAIRARDIGIDTLQLHATHGYLLHQFLSPLSNQRTDGYGGSFENRIRLVLEVLADVREVWPEHKPLCVRIPSTDWMEYAQGGADAQGWTLDQAVALSQSLAQAGVDWIDVSSGGLHPEQAITVGPAYHAEASQRIRRAVDVPVSVAGLITEPVQAESLLVTGAADAVCLARALLWNPRWPWMAAAQLGASVPTAASYLRAAPQANSQVLKPRTRA